MSSLDDAIKRLNKPIGQIQVAANKTPTLTCIITGKSRTTTRQYLEQKAQNVSGDTLDERVSTVVNNYVCRDAIKLLRRGYSVGMVRLELGGVGKLTSEDGEYLNFLLEVNGKKTKKHGLMSIIFWCAQNIYARVICSRISLIDHIIRVP